MRPCSGVIVFGMAIIGLSQRKKRPTMSSKWKTHILLQMSMPQTFKQTSKTYLKLLLKMALSSVESHDFNRLLMKMLKIYRELLAEWKMRITPKKL